MKTLHRVFRAPWPTVSGRPGTCVQRTLEAMSLDGDACCKLHSCSEEHDLNPHFTLSEEQEESRSCVRHRQAETSFFKQTLLNDVLFDATWGKCACDRVDQSHSSISSHIPELCLSLTDSVDGISYQQCKQKPCLWKRQKSLCKHYLLSAKYRFSICNKLRVCLVCSVFKLYFNIAEMRDF